MSAPPAEEIIRAVADELPVGVWVARVPGGEFVYANRRFVEIMGTGARDDVGVGEYAKPYGICTRSGEPYPEERMPLVQAMRARATVVVDDIVIHRPDGGRRFIRAQARPVFDAANEMTHVVIAFIDISREAEAEKARAETDARMQRAQRLESIGNLAGGIAHDFNNLLATIQLTTSNLRLDQDPAGRQEGLDQIDAVVDSAASLTRSLLGFARRGKHTAAPLALDAVVGSVGQLLARTLGHQLELGVELGAKAMVQGDFSQLEQVVLNLAVNARDAMPAGGRLILRTRRAEGPLGAVLEVCDTGTGIPRELRERIFEPYFTTKDVGGLRGTGLGLATVYGIVESHHGAVEVLENAPRGTVMRVSLPVVGEAAAVHPTKPLPGREPVRGSGTVLLVEDDPALRNASRVGLCALGYQVLAACDGFEALELVRSNPARFDVVVMDLLMPRVAGPETFEGLRELGCRAAVVLTTGFSQNEQAQALLDQGASAFLPKPYGLTALAEVIARVRPASR